MAAIRLPCLVQSRACPAKRGLPFLLLSSPSRTSWLKINKMRTMHNGGACSSKTVVHQPSFARQCWPIMSSRDNGEVHPDDELSPLDTVVRLYECINKKELKKLTQFISDDCCFEDYSFVKPLKGKQEVVHFFQQLTECMGKNVKFVIESGCQDDDFSVAITWHLGWKDKCIPFTRGCSFYECWEQEEKIVIKHARIIIESPIKPGALVLVILKLVIYIFDKFPGATEKFVERPYVVGEFLLRLYNLFLEPFIQAILKWYINLMKPMARIVGFMLNILLHISRIFFK